MNDFRGLSLNCAVKVGNEFAAMLPAGMYATGAVRFDNPIASVVFVEDIETLCQVTPAKKVPTEVQFDDDTVSHEEWQFSLHEQMDALENENNELSLDEEYAIKKRIEELQKGKVIYEEVPEKLSHVDINLVGEIQDTGSKYISNPLSFGKLVVQNSVIYALDKKSLVADVLYDFLDEQDLEIDNKSDNSLAFAKVKGKYVFKTVTQWSEILRQNQSTSSFLTLESAQQEEKKIKDELRNYLNTVLVRHNESLDKHTLGNVHSALLVIKSSARDLDVKQKDLPSHRACVNLIDELIEYLECNGD